MNGEFFSRLPKEGYLRQIIAEEGKAIAGIPNIGGKLDGQFHFDVKLPFKELSWYYFAQRV